MSDLNYPDGPGWKGRETSADAALSMEPSAPLLRHRCFDLLAAAPATADEVAARAGLSILSVRPRISELAKLGSIRDTGARRKNDSGRSAIVWAVTEGGRC